MVAPRPQTIYDGLFDKIIAAARSSAKFLNGRTDLYIRGLYRDAEKLLKADFDQGMHVLAVLDCECGDFDSFLQKADVLLKRSPGDIVYIDLLVNAAYKFLKPSVAANVLSVYTGAPNECMMVGAPQLMGIGAYRHFLKADSVMRKANITPLHTEIFQHNLTVAKAMETLGMPEERIAAIIERAGDVLAGHGLKWHGTAPYFTVQNNEIGAWYNIDVTPEQAAQLDDELFSRLIDDGLDTEHFFVSFVGVGT